MIDERVRRSRSWSLAVPAAALVFASGHVSAQDPPDAAAQAPLESIIVTGSRIVMPGVAVSNPVMIGRCRSDREVGRHRRHGLPQDAAGTRGVHGQERRRRVEHVHRRHRPHAAQSAQSRRGPDAGARERAASRRRLAGLRGGRRRHDPVRAARARGHPDGRRLRALRRRRRLRRGQLHPEARLRGIRRTCTVRRVRRR